VTARSGTPAAVVDDAHWGADGPAQDAIIGRLQEPSDRKAMLAQRRAEIELTRLALERESSVLRGWLEQWAYTIEEMHSMDVDA
jgi:hypothetical protein